MHEIYRDWRALLDEYPGERILAAEAWVDPLPRVAKWVRPDEMHQAFNFAYLETPWDAAALRTVIDASLAAFGAVGAPSTWVLSNHDVVRHASRLDSSRNPQGHGLGPPLEGLPDRAVGLRRARAATALMLALPGSAYLYQGEELGLPEVIDLPDDARQDPTWFRTERRALRPRRMPRADPVGGRRAVLRLRPRRCLVAAAAGGVGALARPASAASRDRRSRSTATRSACAASTTSAPDRSSGLPGFPESVVALRNGDVVVVANTGTGPSSSPPARCCSRAARSTALPPPTTAWLRA